jgi:hypothetical protein
MPAVEHPLEETREPVLPKSTETDWMPPEPK